MMFGKIHRFLNKPFDQKVQAIKARLMAIQGVPFLLGINRTRRLFLGYLPDSYSTFNEHAEFKTLIDAFSVNNRLNNGGDIVRLWGFILNIKQVIDDGVEGDFAELGVWRGNTASVLAYYAKKNGRKAILFDTYEGFSCNDFVGHDSNQQMAFGNTSIELVKSVLGDYSDVCELVKGYFPQSIHASHSEKKYSIVSLDCDLYEPMKAGLEFFYPRVFVGGLLMLHDYSSMHWAGAKAAIDEFCVQTGERLVLMPDKSGSAFVRKAQGAD